MEESTVEENFIQEINFLIFVSSNVFLYPFTGKSRLTLIGFYLIFGLIFFTSFQLFFTLCLTGFNSLIEIINIAPNIGVCVMSMIKHRKIFNNNNLYFEYFSHFRFNLMEIVAMCPKKNYIEVLKYLSVIKFIIRLVYFYSFPLILIINSFPWMLMFYENKVVGKDLQYLYPFDGWYPFDKVKWYYVAYAWESFMTSIVIITYVSTDIINIQLISFTCLELALLGNSLKNLITDEDVLNIRHGLHLEETHSEIRERLKNIIIKYESLAKMSAHLSKVLGDVMLVNYTFGSVFICLTAFTFMVVDDLSKSLRYFFFFCSLVVAIFDQCLLGQVLSDHSVDLAKDAYFCNWLYADFNTRKNILMLILRMQKPFILTAKGFVVMNLNTYTCICSSSYQFFNLLRTVYNP